jgi:serine/threonine-protein kinase RsbW
MPEHFKLTRAAELETLPVFQDLVAQACLCAQANPQTTYDIQLAFDEACTNIITHGYDGLQAGSIILEITVESDAILLTLTDFGHPFDLRKAPLPDINAGLEDRRIGGLGLFFIQKVMDQLNYESDAEGNRLYLTKKISRVETASSP